MINDFKSYVQTVGSRLGKAFSMESFGTEEQLEFWELSAEHVSRKKTPAFSDIVNWMDLLYRAPVHFVYKLEDEKLVLDRRQVISENALKDTKKDQSSHLQTAEERQLIQNLEHEVQNLEKKMRMDDLFREHGVTAHSIGQCEHIPLFRKNGEFWGIYCAGPYTKSPAQITPKLSIVGRLLSKWLITLDEEEISPKKEYEDKISEITSDLGSGKLNTEALASLTLKYIVHALDASSGCIIEFEGESNKLLSAAGLDEDDVKHISSNNLVTKKDNSVKPTEEGAYYFKEKGWKPDFMSFSGEYHSGAILLFDTDSSPRYKIQDILGNIGESLAQILDYRYENIQFSDQLMNVYYLMVRAIEKSRDKTAHHTPRMVAFVQRFGMFFGLDDDEQKIITKTAKLHDIGYVGALSIESVKSIGGEIAHPLIGANLIEQLAVHEDVIEGIKTHHEWVNGNGEPRGIKADDIPWSGKIIAVFEFVVEFIETHADDDSKTDEEWIQHLSKELMKRADVEFDMVLIPTVIQLLQMLGWEGCVTLGVE